MTDIAYSMVTTPRQLKASPHADALTPATLKITLSTDSLTPLPIPALTVAVPVGAGDDALAAVGTPITTAAPKGWSTSTDDDQGVLFSPPAQAVLDRTLPVTLTVAVEVNTRPGSGVIKLTEGASGRSVQLPFRKASPLEPLLKYELQPAIVNVTETKANPLPTTFKLLVTNHQTFTVELSCLVFAIPTGILGTDLTEATKIDVLPPSGWRKGSTPLTFVPTSATSLFSLDAGQAIAFSFNQITVNKAVGTATLTVYECGKDQEYPACPSYNLSIAKFPPGADVGNVRLWIDPPPARPQGTKVSVHWEGPQGPTYHLYEDADLIGGGSVSNKGSHELTLVKSRWLTLDVAIAAGRDAAHATVQLHVKAIKSQLLPTIDEFTVSPELIDTTKTAIEVELRWRVNHADHIRIDSIGDVSGQSSAKTTVDRTTTFLLYATGRSGDEVSRPATVYDFDGFLLRHRFTLVTSRSVEYMPHGGSWASEDPPPVVTATVILTETLTFDKDNTGSYTEELQTLNTPSLPNWSAPEVHWKRGDRWVNVTLPTRVAGVSPPTFQLRIDSQGLILEIPPFELTLRGQHIGRAGARLDATKR